VRARAFTPASLVALLFTGNALAADPPPPDPKKLTGIEEPARYADDAGREVGNWVLFLPRNVIDYTFRGTELAATLVADRQLVPRYREVLGKPGADFFVFPTLFAETGTPASIGLRMIFDSRRFATSQRLGYGGAEQVEVESRIVYKGPSRRVPFLLSFEAYYKLQDKREYFGIGIAPHLDRRNHFTPGTERDFGYYTERRVRALVSLGMRLTEDFELFLSTSLYRRQTRSMDSKGDQAISAVFVPGTIPGLSDQNPYTSYSELAARFDTRPVRTRPSPGVLLEGYVGGAHSAYGQSVSFMRFGARAQVYIPIYRRSNILTPRIVLDRVQPLGASQSVDGEVRLPFSELARQPDFRGYDYRRDFISMVASLDYSWQLVPALGLRVFFDAATVAPSVTQISLEQLKHMRYAGGLALDVFAGKSALASIGIAATSDGVRVVGNIGVPSQYGDRQHRD
jgi:hypothetical protein